MSRDQIVKTSYSPQGVPSITPITMGLDVKLSSIQKTSIYRLSMPEVLPMPEGYKRLNRKGRRAVISASRKNDSLV